MLDIGWQELFVIMVMLLLVVKPRDIPKVIVNIREGMAKLRGLTRDFHNTMDDFVEESQIMTVKDAFDEEGRDVMSDLENRMGDISNEDEWAQSMNSMMPPVTDAPPKKKSKTTSKKTTSKKAPTEKAPTEKPASKKTTSKPASANKAVTKKTSPKKVASKKPALKKS